MFDLHQEVTKQQLLKYGKIHGHPDKPKQYDRKVAHVDDAPFDIKAEQEHTYIQRSFINRSKDFGRRLSKRKGERHHPGGGYAGHTIRGK